MKIVRVRWARVASFALGVACAVLAARAATQARALEALATAHAACADRAPLRIEPDDEAPILLLEIYDAQDLLAQLDCWPGTPPPLLELEPEQLAAIVQRATGGDAAWCVPASLELHRGQLIVRQTPAVHRHVRAVLAALRRATERDLVWLIAGGSRAGAVTHEVHDVGDLLPALDVPPGTRAHGVALDPEELLAFVRGAAGGDAAWCAPTSLALHRGQLLVWQTRTVHRNVRAVLAALRAGRAHAGGAPLSR